MEGNGPYLLGSNDEENIKITAPIPFKETGKLQATVEDGGRNRFDFHLTSVPYERSAAYLAQARMIGGRARAGKQCGMT